MPEVIHQTLEPVHKNFRRRSVSARGSRSPTEEAYVPRHKQIHSSVKQLNSNKIVAGSIDSRKSSRSVQSRKHNTVQHSRQGSARLSKNLSAANTIPK